jgi:hypothetical protein
MKTLFILPLIFLTACTSRPKPLIVPMSRTVPGTVLPSEQMESVRYGENVKAYNIGRYIDPNTGLAMHERHTVYRVETTAKWNLHPNGFTTAPMGPVLQLHDAAKQETPI